MPIQHIMPKIDVETDPASTVDIFHVEEQVEVYNGALALAIDHLMNHIKVLVALSYLPVTTDLEKALQRHPVLRPADSRKNSANKLKQYGGRMPDRVILQECQYLLDSLVEIAHLAAWPETADQAQQELEILQRKVPFLDYRYDNDPYPSDGSREEIEP